jgi:hypothetical protein
VAAATTLLATMQTHCLTLKSSALTLTAPLATIFTLLHPFLSPSSSFCTSQLHIRPQVILPSLYRARGSSQHVCHPLYQTTVASVLVVDCCNNRPFLSPLSLLPNCDLTHAVGCLRVSSTPMAASSRAFTLPRHRPT